MKLISIILSFAVLFTGCYTPTAVTKEEGPPAKKEITFWLKDGTHIVAKSYQRTDNGYRIEGKQINEGGILFSKAFSGTVADEQITKLTYTELDAAATVVVVLLFVIVGLPIALSGSVPGGI